MSSTNTSHGQNVRRVLWATVALLLALDGTIVALAGPLDSWVAMSGGLLVAIVLVVLSLAPTVRPAAELRRAMFRLLGIGGAWMVAWGSVACVRYLVKDNGVRDQARFVTAIAALAAGTVFGCVMYMVREKLLARLWAGALVGLLAALLLPLMVTLTMMAGLYSDTMGESWILTIQFIKWSALSGGVMALVLRDRSSAGVPPRRVVKSFAPRRAWLQRR